MAEHNILGAAGEDYACQYLQQKGYTIVARNWHFHHLEIDIIAKDRQDLIFVEVKTRSSATQPRDIVSDRKIRFLEDAAEAYATQTGFNGDMHFDLIVITRNRYGIFELEHINDAFR